MKTIERFKIPACAVLIMSTTLFGLYVWVALIVNAVVWIFNQFS